MLSNIDNNGLSDDMPPWMRELLLRRRNKQLHNNIESPHSSGPSSSSSVTIVSSVTVQQPSSTSRCHTDTSSSNTCAADADNKERVKCNSSSSSNNNKMVQERPWIDHADHLIQKIDGAEKGNDSDSSEELKYGPGIVSKLKNRYLNLTLREAATKNRPSILNLRKATSLEHILDDYEVGEKADVHNNKRDDTKVNRLFERNGTTGTVKNITNRYTKHNTVRPDMKRARSVEIISSFDQDTLITGDVKTKRESLHEEMLVIEGNDKTCNTDKKTFHIEDNKNFSDSIGLRLNRPKRIQPVMNEKEKPPIDKVKQTKKLFERPTLRTKPPQATGEVASKVAGFKTIIDSTKASSKKPALKQKPHVDKIKKPEKTKISIKQENSIDKVHTTPPIPPLRSPIKEYKPEIKENSETSLPSSPQPQQIPDISKVQSSPEEVNGFHYSSLSETPDLIVHSSQQNKAKQLEDFLRAEKEYGTVAHKNKLNLEKSKEHDLPDSTNSSDSEGITKISTASQKKISSVGNSIIYSFSNTNNKDHLPKIEETMKSVKVNNSEMHAKTSPVKEVIITQQKTSPIHQKSSPVQQKSSPIKEKPNPPQKLPPIHHESPNKEKVSPIQQKPSPIKKKPAPTPQKSSPTHQRPIDLADQIITNDYHKNKDVKVSPSQQKEIIPKKESPKVIPPENQILTNGVPVTEELRVEIISNCSESKTINNKISTNNKQKSESLLLKKSPVSPTKEKIPTSTVPPNHHLKQVKNNEIATECKNSSVGKLSDKVIEKNLINAAKTNESSPVNKLNGSVSNKSENGVLLKTNEVPILKQKRSPPRQRQEQQNSLVFDFTSRKDVPDYVGNDGRIKTAKMERPKRGDSGITILPDVTLDESLIDDDEEDWKKLLECPPSPCNITFTNDNILIEGRSSLKKLKKPKMTIRFTEAGPEDIYEYPSETSLLEDNRVTAVTNSSSVGHTIPSLSGSSLSTYTPKSTFQVDEFELGITPSSQSTSNSIITVTDSKSTDNVSEEPVVLQEASISFSAGATSDILF